MQIDRGGMLQRFVLAIGRDNDVRVTMPHAYGYDSAERIEISSPAFIPNVLHFSLHKHDRFLVVEENSRIQEFLAQLQYFLGGRAQVFFGLMIKRREFGCFHVGRISSCSCDWRL